MIEAHPKEANFEGKSLDILLLIIWSIVLFLCAITIKNYYLNGQPPLWDNLSFNQLGSFRSLVVRLAGCVCVFPGSTASH